MKYKNHSKNHSFDVQKIIYDLACEFGYQDYSEIGDIDYKFWEDVGADDIAYALAEKLSTCGKLNYGDWISIDNERKPNNNERVLIHCFNGSEFTSIYKKETNSFYCYDLTKDCLFEIDGVIFWSYLPISPIEKIKK